MPAPDIEKIIRQEVQKLIRIKDRDLPVKVGRAVVESVRDNFRHGGFYGRSWPSTKRQDIGFHGTTGQYGPLLSRQNHLMSSTDYVPGQGKVTIRNSLEYAEIHNEGGEIPVTPKMKKFFWAKYYETGLVGQLHSSGKGQRMKQKKDAYDAESGFWRGMALKRVGSTIKIPERQFLGPDPEVDRIVNDITNKELQNHIKTMQNHIRNGINTRRSR